MSKKKLITLFLGISIAIITILFSTNNAEAKLNTKRASHTYKNIFGVVVVKETLNLVTNNYVKTVKLKNNKKVSFSVKEEADRWLSTDVCWFGNSVTPESISVVKVTNKYGYKNVSYARGTYKMKFGLPSPWGIVGTSGTSRTLVVYA